MLNWLVGGNLSSGSSRDKAFFWSLLLSSFSHTCGEKMLDDTLFLSPQENSQSQLEHWSQLSHQELHKTAKRSVTTGTLVTIVPLQKRKKVCPEYPIGHDRSLHLDNELPALQFIA